MKFTDGLKLYKGNVINTDGYFVRAILWYKRNFTCNLIYRKELKRSYSVAKFLISYKYLFFILVALLIVLISAFMLLKIDGMSFFELVSVAVTYISSALIAIVVYYNTWAQGIRSENKNDISLRVETIPNAKDDIFFWYTKQQIEQEFKCKCKATCGFSLEDSNYIHLCFGNLNHHTLDRICIKKIYITDSKGKVKEVDKYCYITDFDFHNDLLGFGEKKDIFIGFDNQILSKEYLEKHRRFRYFILFEVSNLDGHIAYCMCENLMHGYDGYTDAVYLLNYKAYNDLIRKHGIDVIKNISFGSMIKKHWYQKAELYK